MSAATVTDISTAKNCDTQKSHTTSISIALPVELHEKLMIDSLLGKKPVNVMVEEWIDKYVSLQDVSIGLATMMNSNPVREKSESDVALKGISITISKRHHGLLKMEAMRQQKSIRALLKGWIEENVREWYYEQIDQDVCYRQAA